MIPLFKFAAAMMAKTRAAGAAAEESAIADRLSRLRYDPPTFNLWQLLKTAAVAIPVLLIALWIGKWWLRESVIAEFRVEAAKQQEAALKKDRAENAWLKSEIDRIRSEAADLFVDNQQELALAVEQIRDYQDRLKAAGTCGWSVDTVRIINGAQPVAKPAAKPKRSK